MEANKLNAVFRLLLLIILSCLIYACGSNNGNSRNNMNAASLSISLDESSLFYNESTQAHITLNSHFWNWQNSITVTISSSNNNVAMVSPSSCVLSFKNKTCSVIVNSILTSGIASISASAFGYTESSASLTVIKNKPLYFGSSDGLVYLGEQSENLLLAGSALLPPDGSMIKAMALESGILYVGTMNGNVFSESDGMWYQIGNEAVINNGAVSGLAVEGNRIYASVYAFADSHSSIYVESGSGWQVVGSESLGFFVTSILVHGNNIYAGGYNFTSGVVYLESGEGWQLVDNEAVIPHGIVFSMTFANNHVYAAGSSDASGDDGVVYVESGGSWNIVGGSGIFDSTVIRAIVINGESIYAGGYNGSSGYVYLYSNESWSILGNGPVINEDNGGVNSLAISNGIIYAGGNSNFGGVISVESGNNVWNQLGDTLDTYLNVMVADNNIYAGGSSSIVYAYSDSLWNSVINKTLDGSSINSVATKQGIIYAGTNLGNVYFESNGSNGWQLFGGESAIPGGSIYSIAVNNNLVYAGGKQDSIGESGAVYVSSGNGWQLASQYSLMNNFVIHSIALDGDYVYVGGINDGYQGYVYAESNGGSWNLVGGMPVTNFGVINSLVVSDNQIYAGGCALTGDGEKFDAYCESGFVYVESNGGPWQLIGQESDMPYTNINSIVIHGNQIYAGGCIHSLNIAQCIQAVVYVKVGDSSWKQLESISTVYGTSINSILVDEHKSIYAATNMNSILFSESGLLPWEKLPYSSYYQAVNIRSMAFGN